MFLTTHGQRPAARRRHPRQVPARGAQQGTGSPSRSARSPSIRPIPYLLSDLTTILTRRDGQARPRRRHARRSCVSRPRSTSLSADPRYTVHVLGHARSATRWASFIAKMFRLPSQRQADLDRRRVGRAVRNHRRSWSRCSPAWCSTTRSGRGPRRSGRCCWSAKRRTATCPRTRTPSGQAVAQDPQRIAKEGRKYGISLGPDHPAPVGPGRRRAVAVRHDHLDAPQQRPRPGVREGGDARRRARLPRLDPGAAQPRMHHLRRRRGDPDPRARSTTSSRRSARPRPTRASPTCGARAATKPASSSALSNAGEGTGAKARRHAASLA